MTIVSFNFEIKFQIIMFFLFVKLCCFSALLEI